MVRSLSPEGKVLQIFVHLLYPFQILARSCFVPARRAFQAKNCFLGPEGPFGPGTEKEGTRIWKRWESFLLQEAYLFFSHSGKGLLLARTCADPAPIRRI